MALLSRLAHVRKRSVHGNVLCIIFDTAATVLVLALAILYKDGTTLYVSPRLSVFPLVFSLTL